MHAQLSMFIQRAVEAFDLQGPLYRFGLCPPETPEADELPAYFAGVPYIDLGSGEPDQVSVPLPSGIARTIICFGVLEQVADPGPLVREMLRILAPGGVILLGSAIESATLGGTWIRHRLQPDRVSRCLTGLEGTVIGWQEGSAGPQTLYAIGFKAPIAPVVAAGLSQFLSAFSPATRQAQRTRQDPWSWFVELVREPLGSHRSGRLRRAVHHVLRGLRDLMGLQTAEDGTPTFVVDLPPRLARQAVVPKPHGTLKSGSRLDLMQ